MARRKSNNKLFIGGAIVIAGVIGFTVYSANHSSAVTKLDIKGSTSVEPFIKAVKEENLGKYNIKLSAQGSGTGISALFDKTTDIAMSSRDLKPEEQSKADSEDVEKTVIALDGISIIVNKESNVNNLNSKQVHDIFTGKITNWSEVGGSNLPISVVARDEASGTREGFDKLLSIDSLAKGAKQIEATGEVIRTIADNKGAIGYVSSGSSLDNVKVLSFENIKPSDDNIKSKKYKLFRNFFLLNHKSDKSAHDFVQFTLKPETQELLKSDKYKTNFIKIK